jgi:hypothetical protein
MIQLGRSSQSTGNPALTRWIGGSFELVAQI